jgi:flagellar biosynthesis protein FlhF
MAQALATVRRELGSDAVILHTRQYKVGGFLGIGARNVVELTASTGRAIARGKTQPRRAQPTPKPPQPEPTAGDLIRKTYAAAKAEFTQNQSQTPAPAPVAPAAPMPANDLADELRTVRRMVERMMSEQRRQAEQPKDLPDKLFDQYLSLLKQEVTEELAGEIISEVRATLTADQLEDDATVRRAVLDAVSHLIPAAGENWQLQPTDDGRPRIITLIGPTGVGKTTTVAKLAATFKLKHGKNVGLITLDTYRIAAVDQLRTYANIIGVPLHVVNDVDELCSALNKLKGCDAVLIDTAGRSQKDDPRLAQLRGFIEAADPHEVHLVLSSTCTQNVLLDAIDRFSHVRADRIIFTKLDEAVSFGVVLNVARKVNKQLSYITTGQEVPHQIEPSQADRLAELVVGGGLP